MDLIEFLKDKKCPVTKVYVAERLFKGHSKPAITFHNKLYNVQNRKFSDTEKKEILKILSGLSIEINNLTID